MSRDHLRLHVVSAVDVALQEHLGPAEVRLRLAGGTAERLVEVIRVPHDVHALAAAAERRLHEQREPDALGLFLRVADVDRFRRPRHDRHAAAVRDATRSRLVAHDLDGLGGRTDEREAGVGGRLGEVRALGEEPVSRMDERRPRLARGVEDGADRQVRVRRERRSDPERLVRHLHVQGVAIRVGVDGDGGETEISAGPDDADRDLASVGDQDLRFRRHGWLAIIGDAPEGVKRMLSVTDLERALADLGLEAPVRFDEVTGSTNATALGLAESGAPEWTLVAAGHQTAGRGRLGRTWTDRPGAALMFSFVVRPSLEPERGGLIPLLAGAAMAVAIRDVAGVNVRCKWPNDLLLGRLEGRRDPRGVVGGRRAARARRRRNRRQPRGAGRRRGRGGDRRRGSCGAADIVPAPVPRRVCPTSGGRRGSVDRRLRDDRPLGRGHAAGRTIDPRAGRSRSTSAARSCIETGNGSVTVSSGEVEHLSVG